VIDVNTTFDFLCLTYSKPSLTSTIHMKTMYSIFCLTFILILFVSCEGDDGAVGPAGAQGVPGPAGPEGPQGPVGIAGNANVRQYSFGAYNFTALAFAQLQVTTTLDTMNRSVWNTYLYYEPNSRWYMVPGFGPGASTQYRISLGHETDKVNIYIDKTGVGENFSQVRVVRIYANSIMPGGREVSLPKIDFTDYEAVCDYYGLDY
jgi:hypothetical protein